MSNKERLETLEKKIVTFERSIANQDIEKSKLLHIFETLWKENQSCKNRLYSQTVSLMHQRRKAANDVDDQYFEQEIYIEAHNELANKMEKLKEKLIERNL